MPVYVFSVTALLIEDDSVTARTVLGLLEAEQRSDAMALASDIGWEALPLQAGWRRHHAQVARQDALRPITDHRRIVKRTPRPDGEET